MKQKNTQRNAAETRLTLRNKSTATGLWQVVVLYSHKGAVRKFATGIHVPESYWNETKQEVRSGGAEDVTAANTHLKTVKARFDAIIRQHLQDTGEKPSLEQLNTAYSKSKAPKNAYAVTKVVTSALDRYMEHRRTEIQPNSMKAYAALHQNLLLYQKDTGEDWRLDTLTAQEVDAFQAWLISTRKFHNTTVERRVIALKKFLEAHRELITIDYKALRPKHKVRAARNFHPVTLTLEELEAIRRLPLQQAPRLEKVRDLFLLQTWTGLRFSDVVRLAPEHIKSTKNGHRVRIDINKTGDYSDIPLFPVAAEMLAKYDGCPPVISNQKFNKFIKEVMALAAIATPSLNEVISQFHYEATRKVTVKKPKHCWISSHTSRRTFITLNIEVGTPQHYVMKWSNHTDPRSFKKYQNALQGEADAALILVKAYQSKADSQNIYDTDSLPIPV
ncbi:phage integrase SAM-like domain-containing protein [Hymenobacter sp. HSC-4F20]|uniref:phage integrase SAM-like domain-containing protein n=1 Tax=Hymenobacter sp. HSC-4F20 TaxID=2864135 RepID=UPI001C737B2B|nr:phage integrase SAM-like domain-containing protein [Hymenobacter sp. HSC-4F20]MBX0291707.1 phage integrase SAM-like domain-containing protein [Hymenobacter sp. HSC-4F20]